MSVDKIILGLLRRPATGYELKAAFDRTVRHFWAAELSQIYVTLRRLERQGWLKVRMGPSLKGPARKIYGRTPAGRAALRAWLASEPTFDDERYTYLAQVFFMAELSDWEWSVRFIERLRRKRADQLSTFRQIEKDRFGVHGGSTDHLSDEAFYQYLTLRSGIRTMTARVKWCDEVKGRIEQRADWKRRRAGNKRKD